ncbi:site-specific integrase [Haladaptatus sp. T7]|uniref:tyrosine-type recombinase/integrase n=1 Tax=Haladaptatus sp. T7 TaxID=2029368 RepID=UPI0021A25680|nr:site-specific integrase [Haladaptatus sp. T7]GKZ14885.1 hypothetical protein HAL_27660 [Haladaptatus sp. T7]
MVDFDEVQGYGRKFENQLAKLREASISDADRAAIIAFIQHEEAQGKVNTGTMVNHINRLRLAAERADTPLTEMQDKSAVDGLLFSLKHDHGLAEGTLRNYRKALRKFFRYRDRDWSDDIKIGVSPERTVDPNDLLTDEEIEDLLDAASHPRDKALVSLIADTGLRIGAIASLRIHDVDLTNRAGTVSINEEANVKGATGTVPLTWSRGYVANWLDVHPRNDEEEAALFHKVRFVEDGEDGAMSYQYLGRRIKWIADEAGIDRDRVNTHNFRKTAISRWIRRILQALEQPVSTAVSTLTNDTYQFVAPVVELFAPYWPIGNRVYSLTTPDSTTMTATDVGKTMTEAIAQAAVDGRPTKRATVQRLREAGVSPLVLVLDARTPYPMVLVAADIFGEDSGGTTLRPHDAELGGLDTTEDVIFGSRTNGFSMQ